MQFPSLNFCAVNRVKTFTAKGTVTTKHTATLLPYLDNSVAARKFFRSIFSAIYLLHQKFQQEVLEV